MMSDCRGFVLKNVLKFVDFWCPKNFFVEWEACVIADLLTRNVEGISSSVVVIGRWTAEL